ncbi:MAG: M20/M25/M40 family metallo-hydrolase [Halanaerobiaceae bacterium]
MLKKKDIINTFKELVSLDTKPRQEGQIADLLKKKLARLGFTVREDQAGDLIGGETGNLLAELAPTPGKEDLPPLLFSAHMDKVQPGLGCNPRVGSRYITSAGDNNLGADDLAGVTGIIESLKFIKKHKIEHGKIKIIFTVAEEEGLLGAKKLDPLEVKDCAYGFVLDAEGDVGTIIYRAPFKMKFNARIKGKPAHAGIAPGRGVNAIKIASHAISAMNLGQIDEETTANIGVIKGGVARNVVPDLIELEGEVRSHDQQKLNNQVEEMKGLINKYVKSYQGEVEFDISLLYQGYCLEKDSPLLDYLSWRARELDIPINYKAGGGGSDACVFNGWGLTTINLGIGIENAHSPREKIKKKNLFNLVRYLVAIIKKSSKISDV